MHYCDSKGNVIGISDKKDKNIINLINPDTEIRIKQTTARTNICHSFYYRKDNAEFYVSMKNVIEDGKIDGTDYVYKLPLATV